jgi:isoleucyl-tRNA synthetase
MPNKYNPIEIEKEILEFWEKNRIYEKAKAKNKDKTSFYFLDGPPYTSGKVHLGTAWNKVLKDSILRFKRMNGFNVWDRAGYDMHGMPTEQGVERELKIKNKDEIPKLGVDKFVGACREFAVRNLKIMSKDFKRLGVWMDFDNAYQTIQNDYIEGEWWLIKRAHENKRLYEGEKTMHWCARCGTALAKHELEYKNVREYSIFVKFKIKNKDNEYLIIWTTTPWTIPFNLGVMVNPELEYVKAKVDDEVWIVAKGLASSLITAVAGKKFEVIKELKGKQLEGIEYEHPFADQIKQYKELKEKSKKVHTVVLSREYVTLEAGSGLVHMAPGCGPEDYEIGYRNKIPPFNSLDEAGFFPEYMGEFSGLKAKKDDSKFIEALEKRGAIIAKTDVEHDYAHCWRCKQPVIYRTTKQWFFKVEDLKEKMRELNRKIKWQPEFAGSRSFDSWLANLRDNGITRQRYWGTPLPIWKCKECNDYVVIGSIAELRKLSGKVPDDLHKPWIDKVSIKCTCGSIKKRIPDILDVWVDAGSASWNCLYYPRRKDLFEKLFPADFILEGIDQIRGWFNLLFVASIVAMQKPSFKAVYMHGFINDAQGRKMSKSLGNYILPEEVVDKYGADTLRYYMICDSKAGMDLNYNFDDMKVKHRNLIVLWNLHRYLIDLSKQIKLNPEELKIDTKRLGIEENYIFSKLNSGIMRVTKLYDDYKLDEVPSLIEELFLELSRTYIQLTREKSSIGSEEDKKVVLFTIYNVLMDILKLFTTISPYICEKIYQNLKLEFNLKEESINLYGWPSFNITKIDNKLEEEIASVRDIIQAALHLREKISLGLRWPLKEIVIVTSDKKIERAVTRLKDILKNQVNVKEIIVKDKLQGVETKIRVDYSQLGSDFKNKTPKIIAKIAIDSPETILKHIEREGKYSIYIDGEKLDIVKEHLIITRKVPVPYEEVQFNKGFVYLNRELDDKLEAEGFSREIMRRIQSLRKKADLTKQDRITLFIRTDEELKEMLESHIKSIKEKVGASVIKISTLQPTKKHKFRSKEKIKDKQFELFFDKV